MIFGVAGANGAGKGEVVKYLAERSFEVFSLSDVLREELASQGLSESRERMIEAGRTLRRARGPGALAVCSMDRMDPDGDYAIDSIRHPAEVEVLRGGGNEFQLIWVEANSEARFDRMRARGRAGDPQAWEEFQELDSREKVSEDSAAQQLDAVRVLADFEIHNNGDIASLRRAVRGVLEGTL